MSDALEVEFKPTAHDQLPYLLASRLYQHMQDMGWKLDRHRRGASEFKRLITEYGEQEVIKRVNGYIKHRIERPAVKACADFRDHWGWIGDEIKKKEKVVSDVISPAAARIARELCPDDWPDKAKQQLPAAIDNSLRAYRKFLADLSVTSSDADVMEAALWVRQESPDPEDFVQNWFRVIVEWVPRLIGWKGHLAAFVWFPGHPRFADTMEYEFVKYGGKAEAIRKLLGV